MCYGLTRFPRCFSHSGPAADTAVASARTGTLKEEHQMEMAKDPSAVVVVVEAVVVGAMKVGEKRTEAVDAVDVDEAVSPQRYYHWSTSIYN